MITHYKFHKGETVHAMVIAQDVMHELTDDNIKVWYFTYPKERIALVFWMYAKNKGSGQLLGLLREIETRHNSEVWIADPMFQRMIEFCKRNNFGYVSPFPEISMRRPCKPNFADLKEYVGQNLPEDCEDFFELYQEAMMTAPDTPDGLRCEIRMPKLGTNSIWDAAYEKAAPHLLFKPKPPNSAGGLSKY